MGRRLPVTDEQWKADVCKRLDHMAEQLGQLESKVQTLCKGIVHRNQLIDQVIRPIVEDAVDDWWKRGEDPFE